MACTTSSSALLRVARLRAPECSTRSFSTTLPLPRITMVHRPTPTSHRSTLKRAKKAGTHTPPANPNLQSDTVLPLDSPLLKTATGRAGEDGDVYGRYPRFFEEEDLLELQGRQEDIAGEEATSASSTEKEDFFIYPPKPLLRPNHVTNPKSEDPFQPLLTDHLPPAIPSLLTIAARLELDDPSLYPNGDASEIPRAILRVLTHSSYREPTGQEGEGGATPFSRDRTEITITEESASVTSAYSSSGPSSTQSTTSQLSGSELDSRTAAFSSSSSHPSSPHTHSSSPSSPLPLSPRSAAELQTLLSTLNLAQTGSNASLSSTGRSILGFVLSEYLAKKYPNLPTYAMKLTMDGLTGPEAMKDVGSDLGIGSGKGGVGVRYRGVQEEFVALGSAVQGVVGLIYELKGMAAAAAFINAHFLSRQVDIPALMRFSNPKAILNQAVVRYGMQAPVSRLIAESGRFSNAATYIIGVFCGDIKLGEGWGISYKMAEHRAFTNSLHALYLTQTIKPKMSIAAFTPHPLSPNSPPNTSLERRYASLAPPPGEPAPTHSAAGRAPRNWVEPPTTAEKAGIRLPPTWDDRRIDGTTLSKMTEASRRVKSLGDGDGFDTPSLSSEFEEITRVDRQPFTYPESEGYNAFFLEGRKGKNEKETRILRNAFKKGLAAEFIPSWTNRERKAPFVSERKKGRKEKEDYIE